MRSSWSTNHTIGTLSSSLGQRENKAGSPLARAPFWYGSSNTAQTLRGKEQAYTTSDANNIVEDVDRGKEINDQFIFPSLLASTTNVYKPASFAITTPMGIIASTTNLYEPIVNLALVPALIASTANVYDPASVGTGLVFPLIASTANVYDPAGVNCYSGDWVTPAIGNYALHLSASDDSYIEVGDTSTYAFMHGSGSTSAFKWTVAFWVKLDNTAPDNVGSAGIYRRLVTTYGSNYRAGFAIDYDNRNWIRPPQTMIVGVRSGLNLGANLVAVSTLSPAIDVPVLPSDTNWNHFAVTYDQSLANSNLNIYINGTLADTANKSGVTPIETTSSNPLRMGVADPGAGYFTGSLDDFAIWNVALDSGAVSELYNSGDGAVASSVSASNIVSYFNMDDGPGSGIISGSYASALSSSVTGTLYNFDNGTAC